MLAGVEADVALYRALLMRLNRICTACMRITLTSLQDSLYWKKLQIDSQFG